MQPTSITALLCRAEAYKREDKCVCVCVCVCVYVREGRVVGCAMEGCKHTSCVYNGRLVFYYMFLQYSRARLDYIRALHLEPSNANCFIYMVWVEGDTMGVAGGCG